MEWLTGILPVALVAVLCPLMMLLMMRGMHGGHGTDAHHPDDRTATADAAEVARLREEVAALREQTVRRS